MQGGLKTKILIKRTCSEIFLTPIIIATLRGEKKQETTSVGEDVKELDPCTVGEDVKWRASVENSVVAVS